MKTNSITASLLVTTTALLLLVAQCKPEHKTVDNTPTTYSTLDKTFGFGVLAKVKGIWNGSVSSTTALGSYPEWIVDFRPISENQVSAKNELDTLNDIHMSFFIAKYNNEYRVCFRNGGSFAGMTRVSYFLADSVTETSSESYYRFSEIKKGSSRAFTEIVFRNDSLLMKSYTNKSNSLSTATLHMSWSAKKQDVTSAEPAVTAFSFPKKTLTKDFSNTFSSVPETIYYSTFGGDPYPEADQPYLGKATINYTYTGVTPNAAKKTFLMITTQPLVSGFSINTANMKYRSRYVTLSATDQSFVFNYMHPGTYYLYALYDADGNNNFSSGDWVSTTNTTFTLPAQGNVTSTAQINFSIP